MPGKSFVLFQSLFRRLGTYDSHVSVQCVCVWHGQVYGCLFGVPLCHLLCWQTEPSHLLQTKLAQPRIHLGGENQEEDIKPVIWLRQTSETCPPVCNWVQWNVWYTKYTHGNNFQQ